MNYSYYLYALAECGTSELLVFVWVVKLCFKTKYFADSLGSTRRRHIKHKSKRIVNLVHFTINQWLKVTSEEHVEMMGIHIYTPSLNSP